MSIKREDTGLRYSIVDFARTLSKRLFFTLEFEFEASLSPDECAEALVRILDQPSDKPLSRHIGMSQPSQLSPDSFRSHIWASRHFYPSLGTSHAKGSIVRHEENNATIVHVRAFLDSDNVLILVVFSLIGWFSITVGGIICGASIITLVVPSAFLLIQTSIKDRDYLLDLIISTLTQDR